MFEFAKPKKHTTRKPSRPKGMQTMSAALWATIRQAVAGVKA